MPAELSLAGTGFLLAAAPGPGSALPAEAVRLGVSRPSEETLVLQGETRAAGDRPVPLASIDLPSVTIEAAGGGSGIALEVRRGNGGGGSLHPGAPPLELAPGDSVLVSGALLSLRYAPWDEGETPGFRAWLRADAAGAARVRDSFERYCESLDVPGPVVHDLALALQEALDNVVEHAYRGRSRGVALVEAAHEPGRRLLVTVRDRGPHFDPANVSPQVAGEALASGRLGGLGIHLLRNLVDDLHYVRRSGENRLAFARHLAGA